ncbi:50S ribosomal protein L30e-like protein [Phyllosticta citrichinensis]|uniref:H/ACA ribonucleoprotein complex subunit 2 n=1 Tax=Phyllosticta citrichinensis TaxID=1130410 RepID=A0ABR1XJS0_9PEZI
MAKEKQVKDKKEKKEKRSESDGIKKSKKDKKEKKTSEHVTEALIASIGDEKPVESKLVVKAETAAADDSGDEETKGVIRGALVPFAVPLADDKVTKKLFKTVKKAAKNKTLKRGVKEVVKAVRKSNTNLPASSSVTDPAAVVVIAADISPMDVISHIPVLCEDHNIPYIFVASRAELGAAGNTKRPTSVVMLCRDRPAAKKADPAVKADDEADFKDAYEGVVKAVLKAQSSLTR